MIYRWLYFQFYKKNLSWYLLESVFSRNSSCKSLKVSFIGDFSSGRSCIIFKIVRLSEFGWTLVGPTIWECDWFSNARGLFEYIKLEGPDKRTCFTGSSLETKFGELKRDMLILLLLKQQKTMRFWEKNSTNFSEKGELLYHAEIDIQNK